MSHPNMQKAKQKAKREDPIQRFLLEVRRQEDEFRRQEPILAEYRALLDDADASEERVQTFFEENSSLIPTAFLLNHGLHFDAVISKFRIATDLTSDFCYLTKTSAYWHCVFVELEKPQSRIFKKNKKSPEFHADFSKGISQVTEWRARIQEHAAAIRKTLLPLLVPQSENPIRFRFVLIIGRSSEVKSFKQKQVFATLSDTLDFTVWTFDQIASAYEHNGGGSKSILRENKGVFTFERFNSFNPGFFGFASSANFELNKGDRDRLISEGYDIDAWESGVPLALNGKLANTQENRQKIFAHMRAISEE